MLCSKVNQVYVYIYTHCSGFPCCPRDCQESSPTPELKSINSSVLSFLYGPTLITIYAAAAKLPQSCQTLCDPIDGSPLGSPIPEILQARILEWVAIAFSNAGKWKVKVKSLSRVQLFTTPWTAAYQAPPSMGFSRQEYWSGLPLPSPHTNSNLTQKGFILISLVFSKLKLSL